MLSVNIKSITGQLQALTGEICRLPETNVEWFNHIEKALELCDCIEGSDLSKQDKLHLESSSVSLWNHAVSSKFGGQLSTAANAKLRNLSFKMVHFCNSNTSDEVTLRKLCMMGLKTIRSWLDCNYSDRAESILKVTMEAFAQGQYDTAYSHIQSAKDMLALFPKENGFICQLCYNFGVELFRKKYFDECVLWLSLSHDIGKDKKEISSTVQSCTLRLLATAYLEFKTIESNKKALNAINLANNQTNYQEALEWYNYSYNLFSFGEYSDKNLAKINRNRATCYIHLESFDKARDALSKAESYDPTSPYTQFIIFKLALTQKQQDIASEALQKMCDYASNKSNNDENSAFTADALIRLAAQMAFEKDETNLAATALEIFLKGSHMSTETLTALRCLIRLLLSNDNENDRKSLSRLLEHLRTAYKFLSEISNPTKCSQDNQQVNIQLEATWFTKIAWNLAIQSEKSPDFLRDFFIICYKLTTLCSSDLDSMTQQKTCSLIVAAAYLQLASTTSDLDEKNTLLTEALNYVSSCRIVCNKILSEKLISNDNENKKDTVNKLLLLYEFESRAKLKDPILESVLERAVMMPYSDAKMFETIAALAVDPPANYKNLSIRALKLALRKHLQSSLPDFMAVSKNFHSIIELCFAQTGGHHISETQNIGATQNDLFTYFEEVFEFIEQKAKDKYPEVEILWLMSKAWNFGICFYSSGNFVEAEKWCALGMKFQRHLSTLKNTYEKQVGDS
ncbi:testis-expressed sequence 11 protein-like [Octopus vulgaris]|uniref:Protein ZIP4 homolog n=1 Tax=Octopus vulgaris TaxID=6645 RepID=A0AA36BNN3_OCTVU|nr:testis-expressed sequence 11 protein-like [Octopus vulgaris]